MTERLYRSRDERMIAGVSGGMAERWDLDPALVRIGWVILGFMTAGFAVLLYILVAIVVPYEPDEPGVIAASDDPGAPAEQRADVGAARRAARRERRDRRGGSESAGVVLGAVLILVGIYFLLSQFVPWLNFGRLWPVLVIGLGVLLLMNALSRDSRRSDRTD
jgi:phage shock protein C